MRMDWCKPPVRCRDSIGLSLLKEWPSILEDDKYSSYPPWLRILKAAHDLAEADDLQRLQELLRLCRFDIDAAAAPKWNPLQATCRTGAIECAKALVAARADVGWAAPDTGVTALFVAAFHGNAECVQLCCRNGAKLNARCTHYKCECEKCTAEHKDGFDSGYHARGWTPLEAARDDDECTGALKSALVCHAAGHDASALQRLLVQGWSSNSVDAKGRSALFCACLQGKAACVEALLRADADVNWRAERTEASALHIAAYFGHAACARQLIDQGADLSANSVAWGGMPMDAAVKMLDGTGDELRPRQQRRLTAPTKQEAVISLINAAKEQQAQREQAAAAQKAVPPQTTRARHPTSAPAPGDSSEGEAPLAPSASDELPERRSAPNRPSGLTPHEAPERSTDRPSTTTAAHWREPPERAASQARAPASCEPQERPRGYASSAAVGREPTERTPGHASATVSRQTPVRTGPAGAHAGVSTSDTVTAQAPYRRPSF